ncbi:MAG: glycogen/starch synthase [Bacteroidota bacterium]|nr:glycogen/starch synthase [Bacteroidota bacterium]
MSVKKRVLFLTQEMSPYTDLSEISEILKKLPLYTQDNGMEIRVLMPRFGSINERRHRLHEVVRLSGMNIIINDDDYPLIIKVASLPGARLQVYFLDNEEFFKRKFMFEDQAGKLYDDNQDRMVFFCKGAVETVRKFGWAPDVVHCHGWMTSLVPFYLRTAYKDDPLFKKSKIVYSVYNESLESNFNKEFFDKASINNLQPKDLMAYQNGDGLVNLHKGAIEYSDALIQGAQKLDATLVKEVKATNKPTLGYLDPESYLPAYFDFYKGLMN